jgi:hypothetical protein
MLPLLPLVCAACCRSGTALLHCRWQSLCPVPLVCRAYHMAALAALVIDSVAPACTSRVERDCHSICVFISTRLESRPHKVHRVVALRLPCRAAHITFSRSIVVSPGNLQCPWLTAHQCMLSACPGAVFRLPSHGNTFIGPDCRCAQSWTIRAGGWVPAAAGRLQVLCQ